MKREISTLFFSMPLAFIFSLIVTPAKAQVSKVAGFYSDNIESGGFFMRFIQLNSDSTFKEQWSGDREGDRGIGNYRVINDTILLTYKPSYYDTIHFWKDTIKDTIKGETAIFRFHNEIHEKELKGYKLDSYYELSPYIGNRPIRFYYKHEKLFYMWNKVDKIEGYSRHKMFLFLGKHYKKMRKFYMVQCIGKFGEW